MVIRSSPRTEPEQQLAIWRYVPEDSSQILRHELSSVVLLGFEGVELGCNGTLASLSDKHKGQPLVGKNA